MLPRFCSLRLAFALVGFFAMACLAACGGGNSVTVNGSGGDGGTEAGAGHADAGGATLSIGGSVSGLVGQGLVLADNGGDKLAVTKNGTFTFAKKLAKAGAYAVSVVAQPTSPTESCVVSSGSGTVGTSNVTNVKVVCTTTTFTVGGAVTGLLAADGGASLVLADDGADVLNVAGDGSFTFETAVASGGAYNVTIKTQPPSQTCTVSGGQGTVANANVTSVAVNCVPATYTVGGTISGLAGSVAMSDGAGGMAMLTANGSFAFPTPLVPGTSYTVSVVSQPTSPVQTCVVSNGAGIIGDTNVTNVGIVCTTTTYTVGGTVAGLASGDALTLEDNGGDSLAVSANGAFTFTTPVASGATFAVTVLASPASPAETCAITTGSGTVTNGNVTSVVVNCTINTYSIGGQVTGLAANDQVSLADNAGASLVVTANGSFTFPAKIAGGATYAVTVVSPPGDPVQTCAVGGGSGTVAAADVTSVTINCATNAYTVGGTISGLLGTVVLQDNGGDDAAVSANGSFSFPTPVASGDGYAVTVDTQPGTPAQTCVVSSGSGGVGAGPVTAVSIQCTTNTYTIGVSVSGLAPNETVTLADNGGNDLVVSSNGAATFTTAVASGQPYDVTVASHPAAPLAQTCLVSNGSGVVGGGNVVGLAVVCTTNTYTISGTLSLLGANDAVTLTDNGTDNLPRTTNGTFVFATAVVSGGAYAVTVSSPTSPIAQSCAVSNGSGTVTNANVTNVSVTCTTLTYTVSGTLSGLASNESVVLQDDDGDNLSVGANGGFTFATPVASGQAFSVTVLTDPGSPEYESCSVSGGSGTVGSANVGTVTVSCSPNSFTVGGTVSGLAGTVTLSNEGGASLAVTANGTFSFPGSVTSGQPYKVTVVSNPSISVTQTCVVSSGTGNVADANVTGVVVACTTNTYTIGGRISGIGTGDTVTLLDNGGNALPLTTNGTFTFTSAIASGGSYLVTTSSPSSPVSQMCSVSTGSGPVTNANVTTVVVACTTNSFTVSGTLSGLATGDSVTLEDNAGSPVVLTTNTSFTFGTSVASGAAYAVTVSSPPTNPVQSCVVTNGGGTMGAGNVSNVTVACTTTPGGEGAPCNVDANCSQGWCSLLTSTCVAGQSCKAAQAYVALGSDTAAGIDSCGPGESTDTPAPTHESCCRSLLLPTGTDAVAMRMDKYEVTTGRIRQFVEAINALEGSYNLRAWAQAQVTGNTVAGQMLSAQMSAEVIAFLPTSNTPTTSLDLPAQLGATSMDANVPSEYQGCYMADGAYGAGDYWQPSATLADFGSPARSFSQADYDIKSMNCGTYWIYAAFCAWDGGRLPTIGEVEAVWGTGQYPWTTVTGASAPFWPNPYPYTTVTNDGVTNYYANIPSPSVNYTVNWNNNSFNNNPGDFYFFPNLGSLTSEPTEVDDGTDLTPYIAAPGRFKLDVTTVKSASFAGSEGWQDLAANMLEMTEESSTTGSATFCDCGAYTSSEQTSLPACTCPAPGSTPDTKPGVVRATNLPTSTWVGGSWEGHETADPHDPPYLSVGAYNEPLQTQYGKTGFRCVRPAP